MQVAFPNMILVTCPKHDTCYLFLQVATAEKSWNMGMAQWVYGCRHSHVNTSLRYLLWTSPGAFPCPLGTHIFNVVQDARGWAPRSFHFPGLFIQAASLTQFPIFIVHEAVVFHLKVLQERSTALIHESVVYKRRQCLWPSTSVPVQRCLGRCHL